MSKDLRQQQRETEILAQMTEFVYLQIPEELRNQMKLKSITESQWYEYYREDEKWKELQKAKRQRETEIRVENRWNG